MKSDSKYEEIKDKLKKAKKYDVEKDIPFQCLIGKTKAVLEITIEPDPHGDEKGTHAHFHTTLRCPNKRIVDIPEPDRCQTTNRTCLFIAPLGSQERHLELRKRNFAHIIVQMMAFIEFYGSQLVNLLLTNRGLPSTQSNLRLVELTRIMITSNLINKEQFAKIDKLRKIRNRLAHKPKEHLNFSEKKLFELSMEARQLSDVVREIVEHALSESKIYRENVHK